MKVFICWSGHRSRAVAEALRKWLPNVIQALDPWMSEYIEKGSPWPENLDEKLRAAQIGLICLTRENLAEPWIHFEAGALYMSLKQERVCPYLLDLSPSEIPWPLARFQATRAEKEDTLKLLDTLNKTLGEHALDRDRLNQAFNRWWPDLEEALNSARELSGKPESEAPQRDAADILREVLDLLRNQWRETPAPLIERFERIEKLLAAHLQLSFPPPDPTGLNRPVGLSLEALRVLAPNFVNYLTGSQGPSSATTSSSSQTLPPSRSGGEGESHERSR